MESTLPRIPCAEAGKDSIAAAAMAAHPEGTQLILAAAEGLCGKLTLRAADAFSTAWLKRSSSPYAEEILGAAARLERPGMVALNLSYEWACTSGVRAQPGAAPEMARVLDWAMDGLGEGAVLVRAEGPAGDWIALGWPGFAGCVTGMAPGRFAGAINQPPRAPTRFGGVGDWLAARPARLASTALPPAHLLRQVFETCATYNDAVAALSSVPICAEAIFTLCGTQEGEGCVIERTCTDGRIRRASPTVRAANHWESFELGGQARGEDTEARSQTLGRFLSGTDPVGKFGWLTPPVLNRTTRLAAAMRPADGTLLAVGFEELREGGGAWPGLRTATAVTGWTPA